MTPASAGRRTAPPRASLRQRGATALSAISIAVAHAPENAGYGLVAFAPLGLAFGPTAMGLALLGSVIANVVASTAGAGRLVASQRASLSLLLSGLLASVSATLAADGGASPARVLSVAALAVACTGVLQLVFGWLRLGRVVKYTPHPVRVGVVSGAGLLLILTALPVLTGHPFGQSLRSSLDAPRAGAVAVGLCALFVAAVAQRLGGRIPPILLGLCAATGVRVALGHWLPGAELGALIGTPSLSRESLMAFEPALLLHAPFAGSALLATVAAYAVTAAVLCSLDTLLTVSVVDGRLRLDRDADRELRGQGLANVVTGLLTGQAFSPAMPRSLALATANPRSRHVIVLYAAGLLAVLLLVPQWIGEVPVSAIGGVLLLQGFQMVAPAFWRAPLDLWRQRRRREDGTATAHDATRRGDWAIELVVACSAVAFGLGQAVLIGATFAVLLFVRANMRDVVRHQWSGRTRRSLRARPTVFVEALAREGDRIALLELEGSVFFGTADGLRTRLQRLEATVDTAILDLRQVDQIDVTAARILFETAEDWEQAGRRLVFTEWSPSDPRRRLVEVAGAPSSRFALRFFDHTDLALEEAEDRLLQQLRLDSEPGRTLTLAETMLGRALDDDELATLSSRLSTVHVERGARLFAVGDPGDALYVSLQGDIGLRSPGSDRRLASFAPGVVIGEMAMLSGGTRSAEAVAESDVVLMKLSGDAFDRLIAEHPALAAKLLRNIALHLGDRVRTLTGDMARWVSRSAAGRSESQA